jgi:hypothetical protein
MQFDIPKPTNRHPNIFQNVDYYATVSHSTDINKDTSVGVNMMAVFKKIQNSKNVNLNQLFNSKSSIFNTWI